MFDRRDLLKGSQERPEHYPPRVKREGRERGGERIIRGERSEWFVCVGNPLEGGRQWGSFDLLSAPGQTREDPG